MEIDTQKYPPPRSRHHTNPQSYLPIEQLHVVPKNYPPLVESCDWSAFFADGRAPQALDIGCGWGNFLLDYALLRKDINVLGIETRETIPPWLNAVIKGENINNAYALWYTVANGLSFIDKHSIESVFYFFPDPWFKRRHHKRRAFNTSFLDSITRVLSPDGCLYLMTDVPEVDEYQLDVLKHDGRFSVEKIEAPEQWIDIRTDHELHSLRLDIPYVRRRCTLKTRQY